MVAYKEKNFISAVIYVHNNEHTISHFLRELNEVLNENFAHYEIICVDDASTDGSVQQIRQFASAQGQAMVSVIHMSYFQGLEMAMNAGVDLAIGDFVYEFDLASMDYEKNLVMELYRHSLQGYDIVSAVPKQGQKLTSRGFYSLFNRYANNEYPLMTESFRILSRRAIHRVHSMSKTIPYRKAIYANCGLKWDHISYVGISALDQKAHKAKQAHRKEVAVDSLILFTDVAYQFSFAMTLLMMCFTVLSAGYAVYVFLSGTPIEGWTTLVLLLSFSFFGVFALMAIVIKYLSILVDLVFKKQKYTIESIEKVAKSQ